MAFSFYNIGMQNSGRVGGLTSTVMVFTTSIDGQGNYANARDVNKCENEVSDGSTALDVKLFRCIG